MEPKFTNDFIPTLMDFNTNSKTWYAQQKETLFRDKKLLAMVLFVYKTRLLAKKTLPMEGFWGESGSIQPLLGRIRYMMIGLDKTFVWSGVNIFSKFLFLPPYFINSSHNLQNLSPRYQIPWTHISLYSTS